MKKQFVWLVGFSAVGKQTTIDALRHGSPVVHQTPEELCELFGLVGSNGIEQAFYGSPSCDIVENEPVSFDGILEVAEQVGCVLIKWQTRYGDACVELKKLRPDDQHIAIHLHREQQEHLRSFKKKHGERLGGDKAAEEQFFRANPKNKRHCECLRDSVHSYLDVAIISGRFYLV